MGVKGLFELHHGFSPKKNSFSMYRIHHLYYLTVFVFIIVNHSNPPLGFLSSFVSGYLKLAKSMMIS